MTLRSVSQALSIAMLASLLVMVPGSPALSSTPNPSNFGFNNGSCEWFDGGYGGNGSENNPYLVVDARSLWEVADCSVTNSQAAHFKLANDINVADGTLNPIPTAPIGSGATVTRFQGILDGQNYTIRGISISSQAYGAGLFMQLHNATFRNLTIEGRAHATLDVLESKNDVGSAGGLAKESSGHLRLESVTNFVNVSGDNFVGGFIGRSTGEITVTNSANIGIVTASNLASGGLVGFVDNGSNTFRVSGFTNNGTVSAGSGAGGLLGNAHPSVTLAISGAHNLANVSSSGRYSGGLVGFAADITITNSSNSGAVSGTIDLGGLVGAATNLSLVNVANSGNVDGPSLGVTNNTVGGLAGSVTGTLDVEDSVNSGDITAPRITGGLVGFVQNTAVFERVTNSGNVSGDLFVGGVLGWASTTATFTSAHNLGDVAAASLMAGGIFGRVSGSAVVSASSNDGSISGGHFAAGIGGQVDADAIFEASSNRGAVTGGDYTGGIAGHVGLRATASALLNSAPVVGRVATGGLFGSVRTWLTVSGSQNVDAVSGMALVGGLVGESSHSSLVRSSNTGSVTGTHFSVGGLLGESDENATIENSFNTGDVTGADDVGGLVGWSRLVTIEASFNTGDVAASMSDVAGRLESAGGLVGNAQAPVNIESSFNTGAVSSRLASGGFVGFSYVEVAVTKSYNVGSTTTIAGGEEDGLIGIASDSSLVNVDGFYSSERSDFVSTSSAADLRLRATYLNWDFTTVWGFGSCTDNQGLPMLRAFNQISSYSLEGCPFVPPAPQNPAPEPVPSAPAVNQPLPTLDQSLVRTSRGSQKLFTGQRLDLIRSASINGLMATVSQLTATSFVLAIPDLVGGRYSLDLETRNGQISFQGLIEINNVANVVVEEVSETYRVVSGLNPRSSWLNRPALSKLEEIFEGKKIVTCIAYNHRPGVVARKKALSRAIHACSVAKQQGMTTRVFVYGKAPNLADSVKILFR
jgi:hypothetical protein